MLEKIWKWIEYNRFTVIVPILAVVIWSLAVGCTARVPSPVSAGIMVNAAELQLEFQVWQKDQETTMLRFEAAGKDLEEQEERQAVFWQLVTRLASGGIADWPGLLQLVIGGGLLGALSDNIRKRGLIAGLKRNATT